MAVSSRRAARLGVVACCGALAVPAAAPASHMSDMPWCPHSEQQGADPAAGTGLAGGAPRAAPATGPLGSTRRTIPGASNGTTSRSGGSGSAGQAVQQPANVGVATAASTMTATATAEAAVAQVAGVPATTTRVVPTAEQLRAARRAERREARGLARARAEIRAERARAAAGEQIVARVRLTMPEHWLTSSVSADESAGVFAPAVGGGLLALLALAGAAWAITRRRRGGSAAGDGTDAPPQDPAAGESAAIEAELQEIIAEERAARSAEREPALRG